MSADYGQPDLFTLLGRHIARLRRQARHRRKACLLNAFDGATGLVLLPRDVARHLSGRRRWTT